MCVKGEIPRFRISQNVDFRCSHTGIVWVQLPNSSTRLMTVSGIGSIAIASDALTRGEAQKLTPTLHIAGNSQIYGPLSAGLHAVARFLILMYLAVVGEQG